MSETVEPTPLPPASHPQTDADWQTLEEINKFELETKEGELDNAPQTHPPENPADGSTAG